MFTRGETVVRIRRVPVLDPYSQEVTGYTWDGAPETPILNVAVEPRPSTEPLQDARNAVVSGFTLYMKSGNDVQPTDRIGVRGVVYDVDGETAEWRNPYTGTLAGLVVQTKKVAG